MSLGGEGQARGTGWCPPSPAHCHHWAGPAGWVPRVKARSTDRKLKYFSSKNPVTSACFWRFLGSTGGTRNGERRVLAGAALGGSVSAARTRRPANNSVAAPSGSNPSPAGPGSPPSQPPDLFPPWRPCAGPKNLPSSLELGSHPRNWLKASFLQNMLLSPPSINGRVRSG